VRVAAWLVVLGMDHLYFFLHVSGLPFLTPLCVSTSLPALFGPDLSAAPQWKEAGKLVDADAEVALLAVEQGGKDGAVLLAHRPPDSGRHAQGLDTHCSRSAPVILAAAPSFLTLKSMTSLLGARSGPPRSSGRCRREAGKLCRDGLSEQSGELLG